MKIVIRWGVISLLLILCHMPLLAQDTIILKPLNDKAFGFTTLVPDGWTDAGDGLYERARSSDDITVLLQQSISASPSDVLSSLLPRLGLTRAPQSVGTYQSAAFEWALYRITFKISTLTVVVDLALAQDSASGKTYLVSLQTSSDEYDALHKAVFLPVLNALTPAATNVPFNLYHLFSWIYNVVRNALFNPSCSLKMLLQNTASCRKT